LAKQFELQPKKIATHGAVSLALLRTDKALFLAVANSYDSLAKSGQVNSDIYVMGTNDTEVSVRVDYRCADEKKNADLTGELFAIR
jgi:hypothetical protein